MLRKKTKTEAKRSLYHKIYNEGMIDLLNNQQAPNKTGQQIYEAVLAAKREFHINNIALELKIHSLYNRNHLVNKSRHSKRASRWKLLRAVFSFVFYVNNRLIAKKIMGIEPQCIMIPRAEEDLQLDTHTLTWLAGELSSNSMKMVKRKRYLFYEDSIFLRIWSQVIILMFVYTAVFLPYRIAFIEDDPIALQIIDIIANIIFVVDIGVTFFTVAIHNGVLVEDVRQIALGYVKTWLILDIVSVIPFDYLITSKNSRLNDFTKLIRIIKLLRILRLIKISDRLSKNRVAKKLSAFFSINRQFSDLFTFFHMIILLTHIVSCLWYFLVTVTGMPTWVDKLRVKPNSSFDIYVASFYWAITTICTVGFGDIVPNNIIEKVFNIIWIGVGVAFYSYTIGTLSSLLNNLNRKKSVVSSRFAFLNEFAKEKKIEQALLEKITINLEFLEESNRYTDNNISMNFLSDISIDLTYEIAKHVHKDLINKVVLFDNTNINFVAQMIPYLVPRKFRPGEIIYKKNEYPSFVYFVLYGRVGFFNESNLMFSTYIEGSYFGEIEIFKSCLRQNQVKVLSEAKMLLLPREVLIREMSNFQELAETLYRTSIVRDICNKRYSKTMTKMRFTTFNSLLPEDEYRDFFEYQQKCYRVVQDLKKKVNDYGRTAQLKCSSNINETVERVVTRQDSIKSAFFSSKLMDSLEEISEEPQDHFSKLVTDLKVKFEDFRGEIQSNNKFLRILLGQCLGHSIEFIPHSLVDSVGVQCNLNDEHSITDLSANEIENDPRRRNQNILTIQPRKSAQVVKEPSYKILIDSPCKSEDPSSPANPHGGTPNAVNVNRVNLFEDEGFKRMNGSDEENFTYGTDTDNKYTLTISEYREEPDEDDKMSGNA